MRELFVNVLPNHILIIDDHEVTRFGLVQWLRVALKNHAPEPYFSDVSMGAQALELMRSAQNPLQNSSQDSIQSLAQDLLPPVTMMVIDVDLPDMLGIEVIRTLRTDGFEGVILVVSGSHRVDIYDILDSGANGFVSKEAGHTTFIEAVMWLLEHPTETWLPPVLHRRMLHSDKILQKNGITPAERNVLRFITLSNKEIADKLLISESTVKKHLWSIFQKLGIESRQEAFEFAVSSQLLEVQRR